MAHDFCIRVKEGIWKNKTKIVFKGKWEGINHFERVINEKYKDIPDDEVFFFGYAEGIFYQAFNCEEHDMICSGDEEYITINYQTAFNGLKKAIEMFDKINYPDSSRINDVKAFYERMKTDYKDIEWFEICFS